MVDRHEAHDGQNLGQDLPQRDAAPVADRPVADRPVADREVPLPGTAAVEEGPALVIQQWLDGETSEAEARGVDSKQVDLWKMILAEAEQGRRITTPSHVAANIMAAIPDARMETRTVTAIATSTTTMVESRSALPMTMVLMLGAALFAIGIVIGKML
jgi:hypothetical protein